MHHDWQDLIATVQAGPPRPADTATGAGDEQDAAPDNVTPLERPTEERPPASVGADPFAASS